MFGAIRFKTPVEKSGGGSLDVAVQASAARMASLTRAHVGRYYRALVESLEQEEWPEGRERNREHSKDTFVLTDESRGWFIMFRLTNAAPWTAFVYYPGLGKGPHPGPGPWRLWEDKILRVLRRDLPVLQDEVRALARSVGVV